MSARKKDKGYVIHIRYYPTELNHSYDAETINVRYGGIALKSMGDYGFLPYKSEGGAKRGLRSWKRLIDRYGESDDFWRYEIIGIVPVTKSVRKEVRE